MLGISWWSSLSGIINLRYSDGSSFELLAVSQSDGFLGRELVGESYKSEASGSSGLNIFANSHALDITELHEIVLKLPIFSSKIEVANIDSSSLQIYGISSPLLSLLSLSGSHGLDELDVLAININSLSEGFNSIIGLLSSLICNPVLSGESLVSWEELALHHCAERFENLLTLLLCNIVGEPLNKQLTTLISMGVWILFRSLILSRLVIFPSFLGKVSDLRHSKHRLVLGGHHGPLRRNHLVFGLHGKHSHGKTLATPHNIHGYN